MLILKLALRKQFVLTWVGLLEVSDRRCVCETWKVYVVKHNCVS